MLKNIFVFVLDSWKELCRRRRCSIRLNAMCDFAGLSDCIEFTSTSVVSLASPNTSNIYGIVNCSHSYSKLPRCESAKYRRLTSDNFIYRTSEHYSVTFIIRYQQPYFVEGLQGLVRKLLAIPFMIRLTFELFFMGIYQRENHVSIIYNERRLKTKNTWSLLAWHLEILFRVTQNFVKRIIKCLDINN